VDHSVRWEGTGEKAKRILEAPGPERLKAIRDLVTGVTGLQADRGDQLIVESLPFESTLSWEPPPPMTAGPSAPTNLKLPAWLEEALRQKNMLVLGGIGAAALLALLGLVLLVLLRRKHKVRVEAGATALPPGERPKGALEDGKTVEQALKERLAEQAALKARQESEVLSSLKLPAVATKKAEVLTKHLTEEAKKNPAGMAQLLRTWMSEGRM